MSIWALLGLMWVIPALIIIVWGWSIAGHETTAHGQEIIISWALLIGIFWPLFLIWVLLVAIGEGLTRFWKWLKGIAA